MTAIQQRWGARFAALEPELGLPEICLRLAQPYSAVQRWAAFFGYAIRDGRGHRVSRIDWDQVDWSLRDADIARKCGVSRERVRQVRNERGAGPAAARQSALQFREFLETHRERLNNLSLRQVLQSWGGELSLDSARRIARAAGLELLRVEPKWSHLDWRLPNRDLAEIHGLREQHVANIRSRLRVGPAKWDSRTSMTASDPDYRAARAAERRRIKAREPGVPRSYWLQRDGHAKPRLPIALSAESARSSR